MSEFRNRKEHQKKIQRIRQIFFTGAAVLLGAIVCIIVFTVVFPRKSVPASSGTGSKKTAQEASVAPPESEKTASKKAAAEKKELARYKGIKETSLTVSSVGDCTLGTDENFRKDTSLNAYYNMYGAEYFLKNVRSIFEKDDLTIVNMEGTLTTETARAEKKYAFKADPSYVKILTSGSVEAANLANNHSKDYRLKSFEDTRKTLKDAGIITFGYSDVSITEIKNIKVGLIGIYELADHLDRKTQLITGMQKAKDQGAQLIIVNFHWGIERQTTPDSTQVTLAHLAVDLGADLVVGHHPHVLQGIETYKDKYIAYSLGNFCFGGNKNPQDKDTMIFQQTFTVTDQGVKTDDKINIIPCSISSTAGANNYQPTPSKGSEKDRIQKKIEDLSKGL